VRLGERGSFWGLILFFVLIYLSIVLLIIYGLLSWYSLALCLSIPLCVKLIGIVIKTDDWVLLDEYGKYVRIIYFINGIAIIAGIWR
jgi:1,4-dihydroxy-2-naphthoate octaprenyltransferase